MEDGTEIKPHMYPSREYLNDLMAQNKRGVIAFKCSICDDEVVIEHARELPNGFAICDNCKADLKEFVLEKRGKQFPGVSLL